MKIDPYWTQDSNPAYWYRTSTKYQKVKTESLELEKSGLFNEITEILPYGAYIAGSFAMAMVKNNLNLANDIDIFFESDEAFVETYKALKKNFTDYTPDKTLEESASPDVPLVVFSCPEKKNIQLIKLIWFEDPKHIIDTFDVTVVQFAANAENIFYNPLGLMHLMQNKLVYHRLDVQDSKRILERTIKYGIKGFDLTSASLDRFKERLKIEPEREESSLRRVFREYV